MKKKIGITVVVVVFIAAIVIAFNQMDLVDQLKKMHGG